MPLASASDLQGALDLVQQEHPSASHLAWASRLSATQTRYSDAGEPRSSAGKPILDRLVGQDLEQVLCVVVRYFGGTKLGVGGLIRAYGGTATEVVSKATIVERIRMASFVVSVEAAKQARVRTCVSRQKGTVTNSQWSKGRIHLSISVMETAVEDLQSQLTDACRGCVDFQDG